MQEDGDGRDEGAAGGRRYIVASAHLVSERAAALSELEFGLITAGNAFHRWIVRCMAAAGMPDLSALDVLVLHSVHHRARGKRLADICFVLNVEKPHTVNYALRKLLRLELVRRERKGKDVIFETTAQGADLIRRYREVREACLVSAFRGQSTVDDGELAEVARALRTLSGLYDQASRAATSL